MYLIYGFSDQMVMLFLFTSFHFIKLYLFFIIVDIDCLALIWFGIDFVGEFIKKYFEIVVIVYHFIDFFHRM